MPLAVRQWTCPDGGTVHDRDVNAARNLLAVGLATLSCSIGSSAECEARGRAMRLATEEGAGSHKIRAKPAFVKQEVILGPV